MSEHFPKNGHGELDLGADRDTREPKPCLAHFERGRWCWLRDGHEGAHDGAPAREHPAPDFMPRSKR